MQSAEDKFYELEDFHKERIAGGMKRFLHKVWAGTKGVFKLQPIQNARKGAEKFDEKVDFQVKQLFCAFFQHPVGFFKNSVSILISCQKYPFHLEPSKIKNSC